MFKRSISLAVVGIFTVVAQMNGANWGPFHSGSCSGLGTRQYSAQLMNIRGSWEVACAHASATINGHSFASPSRCVNNAGMWGEFDVPDATCQPHWGTFKKDACDANGHRQFSAVLENIPPGVTWEAACAATPATLEGQSFARPNRCKNTTVAMWGEFDVADATCAAKWGPFQKDVCNGLGVRQYSAVLHDIPPGASWEQTCGKTPAVVAGQAFPQPTRCKNTGVAMWGQFDVADSMCRPKWGTFKKDACRAPGLRQYSALLEDIPPGLSWEQTCIQTPATVEGQVFAKPARCKNTGVGMWGEFDLTDRTCVINPAPAALTKPSDVFFSKAGEAVRGDNNKTASSIVARDVVLRGWIAEVPGTGGKAASPYVLAIGAEDVHYQLDLDYEFIRSRYGNGTPSVLSSAMLPGNPQGAQTSLLPFRDRSPAGVLGDVDVNSFWLPNNPTTGINLELNCWHTTSSNARWAGIWAFKNNYVGRGPAPAGWIRKEYPFAGSGRHPVAADSWWPYDPDNPDDRRTATGESWPLQVGDYVEVAGTLWQDAAHEGTDTCWDRVYKTHAGWLEIHPPDSIRHVDPAPARPPEIAMVSLCADPSHVAIYNQRICPEGVVSPDVVRTPTAQVAHFNELVDGRFTTPSRITGGATLRDDCVDVHWQATATNTDPSTLKASYVVTW